MCVKQMCCFRSCMSVCSNNAIFSWYIFFIYFFIACRLLLFFYFLYLCQQPALSKGGVTLHVSVLQSLHTPCCNFGTNHVVNGSFYRDVNIKLKDHYLFSSTETSAKRTFFCFLVVLQMPSHTVAIRT
jgi:hypothetical protein